MLTLAYDDGVADDLNRIAEHLLEHEVSDPADRLREITEALGMLRKHPFIGRPVKENRRELVIGRGSRGYLALYAIDHAKNRVVVLAIRSQRELGYPREY
ncbi:MAG: type II toxin-antitoxin system RelE/ParE family toxin [Archangium sp.]|nr:type II toxin-antitoxin system RelE/ParE family toxin [Archangium sp.]